MIRVDEKTVFDFSSTKKDSSTDTGGQFVRSATYSSRELLEFATGIFNTLKKIIDGHFLIRHFFGLGYFWKS